MRFSFSAAAFAVLALNTATQTHAAPGVVSIDHPVYPQLPYSPPVREPAHGDVWCTGQRRNVVWDTSNPQVNIKNPIGRILLRKGSRTTNIVLAQDFHILAARIPVIVPDVPPGNDYRVVLIGTPDNFGPRFTVAGKDDVRCRR